MTDLQRSKLRNLASKADDILTNQQTVNTLLTGIDDNYIAAINEELDKKLIDVIIAIRQLGDEMLGRTNL